MALESRVDNTRLSGNHHQSVFGWSWIQSVGMTEAVGCNYFRKCSPPELMILLKMFLCQNHITQFWRAISTK